LRAKAGKVSSQFDVIGQVREKLANIGCPDTTFAVFAGRAPSTCREWLNGHKPCPREQSLLLLETARELETLFRFAQPFHVDFKKVQAVQSLLRALRSGELRPACERTAGAA